MNCRGSMLFRFLPFMFAAAWIVSGCASTGGTDEALQEWDLLAAQNEALQERIDLLEERLAACNSRRMDSSAVIQFQGAMIETQDRVIQSQKEQLSDQQSVIRKQAQTINTQAEAVEIVACTYNLMSDAFRPQLGAGQITMTVENGILRMSLSSEILFPSGSATLSGSGADLAAKVAQGLEKIPVPIVRSA